MAKIRSRVAQVLGVAREPGGPEALEVKVEGQRARALNYPDLTGRAEAGDEVLLNTTAVHLGLGTGGFHFVMANLTRPETDLDGPGHIMRLRYTPWQLKVLAAEEPDSPHHDALAEHRNLEGMPVVVGTVHSQLPAIAAGVRSVSPEARIAYVMTEGGALPASFSHLAAELRAKGLIAATVTCGHAFGGDYEAVNVYSALLVGRHVAEADVAVCSMGPGGVGTSTPYGCTALEAAEVINAAFCLDGDAILALRMSFADRRSRHHGVSEHSLMVLRCCHALADFAVPELPDEQAEIVADDLAPWRDYHNVAYPVLDAQPALKLMEGLDIHPTTMGRSVQEDRAFFLSAGAAGILAGQRLEGVGADE
ncbi:MAG: DUF3866 family protein [Armatimonadota bacterium]